MNRQFQNFHSMDNSSSASSLMPPRPNSLNTSLNDYNDNQNQNMNKSRYNPNPFGQEDAVRTRMAEQRSSNEKREIAILFYSNNCDHSKSFLSQLYKTPLNENVRKICVDSPNVKIPNLVTAVPTLIAKGINRPLVGEQILSWLDSQQSKTNDVPSDLQSYSFGGGLNSQFAFLGENLDDRSVVNSNIADWDKDYYINAPLDTDGKDKKSNSNTMKQSNTQFQSSDISKLRNERDSFIPKGIPKNTAIDPEKFNRMFMKQQQNSQFTQNIRNI